MTEHRVRVSMDGEETEHDWPESPETTLLELLRLRGLDAPSSCEEGRCGACVCQVTEGEVKMRRNEVLDATDLADGYILACQSLPVTPNVSVTYD